jgi:hypothetical protein
VIVPTTKLTPRPHRPIGPVARRRMALHPCPTAAQVRPERTATTPTLPQPARDWARRDLALAV